MLASPLGQRHRVMTAVAVGCLGEQARGSLASGRGLSDPGSRLPHDRARGAGLHVDSGEPKARPVPTASRAGCAVDFAHQWQPFRHHGAARVRNCPGAAPGGHTDSVTASPRLANDTQQAMGQKY